MLRKKYGLSFIVSFIILSLFFWKFAEASCGVDDQYDDFFVELPAQGEIMVTLHPGFTINPGEQTTVAFGIPFPRNTLSDAGDISVFDLQNNELPSNSSEGTRWNSLSGDPAVDSPRSVIVFTQVVFPNTNPMDIIVKYGQTPNLALPNPGLVETTWVPIAGEVNPDEYAANENIMEPAVYATLPVEWLSICMAKTRTAPMGSIPGFENYEEALLGFAQTAVNDVPPTVTSLINYEGGPEPWLFDRTMTLFNVYMQTGEVKWLRHAHRSAQFYANHIAANGSFDLKPNDLKYAYGQSLLLDVMFFGAVSLLDTIESVASFVDNWNAEYDGGNGFWTERHQAYSLLGALSAWEATGSADDLMRVQDIIAASFDMVINPSNGWSVDGCMLHTLTSHEGGGGDAPVCSPWMSALFADAVRRYYIHSEDENALIFLRDLANYVKDIAMVGDTPAYLASSELVIEENYNPNNPATRFEHACDVAGLVAGGAWAQTLLDEDPGDLVTLGEELKSGCEEVHDYWHQQSDPTRPEWLLQPPRKFNWWFGSNADMAWMLCVASQYEPIPIGIMDFGDAPDTGLGTGVGNYRTLEIDNGASHLVVDGAPYFGSCVDADTGEKQNVSATADDSTLGKPVVGVCENEDDEDGVAFWKLDTPGALQYAYTIEVTGSGYVHFWMDWNADGDWTDPGEKILDNLPTDTNIFSSFFVPFNVGAVEIQRYARFRITSYSSPDLLPTEPADDGEVEDYRLTLDPQLIEVPTKIIDKWSPKRK